MKMRSNGSIASLGLTFLIVFAGPASAATFEPIGFLPGQSTSVVVDLSADGTVALGTSGDPFIWQGGTPTSISGGLPWSWLPRAISGDGSVAVGTSPYSLSGPAIARWEGGTLTLLDAGLDFLEPDSVDVIGISLDGTTTAGHAEDSFNDWRYGFTEQGGTVTNEAPPGYVLLCGGANPAGDRIDLMSDDAQVFVGAYYCDGIGLSSTPATWNASGSLLSPPLSETRGLSADGLVLVGSDGGHAALKQGTQVTPLGPLPGGSSSSVALDASADGARIVGRAETVQGPVAFVWDAGEGMRAIAGLIEPPLVGWTLEEAVAISADGMIIAGNGVNPDGHAEGWVVDLTPSVPIGDTGVLVAALVALLVGSGLLAMRRSSA